MTIASVVLLAVLAIAAAPLYFRKYDEAGTVRTRILPVVLLVLLGLSALAGVLGSTTAGAAAYCVAVLAAGLGGGPVTVAILQISYNREHPDNHQDVSEAPVLRGGAWIGFLERVAISGTLLAGWPEGMAVVLAVKGLGRYSELGSSAGVAERFILGTFASVLWAAAVTGVGWMSIA
ncbi:hypothetical protein [Arthrobacter castelli]|uniref:hypothetical protein n=1 Tax=Arthrobacter castelli TaxID=271431 RepID=UPI0004263C39|nr:hypothetical protein [Arthrobacter castelli]